MEQGNDMQELIKVYTSEVNKIFRQLQTDSVMIYLKKNMLDDKLFLSKFN